MLEAVVKILGTIALIILAIILFPFAVIAFKWILSLIAGITFGGFLTILLIALICYLIWGN